MLVGKYKKMELQFKQKSKESSKALKSKIKLIGSGRTDAGVNAWGQSANFKVNNEIKNIFKILTTVNFYLNKHSISVIKLKKKKS